MKSLRLHKYTDRLLGLTYEELVTLTDKYVKLIITLCKRISKIH